MFSYLSYCICLQVIFIVKLINLLLSLFATGYYSGEIKIFKYATKVGDAAGEHNICHMWQQQFANLYSSIACSQHKEIFMNRINTLDSTTYSTINVPDIIDAINSPKKEKVLELMAYLWMNE